MKRFLIFGLGLTALAALAIAGCSKIQPIHAPGGGSGSADFRVIAAMGTSISAGVQSGGLVVTHQQKAFPYLFARQAGAATFTIPSISADGLPPLLRLLSLAPLVISNAGRVPGVPTNYAQPTAYHDMGVPFSLLLDVADSTNYYGGPLPRDPAAYAVFATIVRHRGTILSEVASLNPTFVTIEFGSNEVLGAAVQGSGAALVDAFTYSLLLTIAMNGLAATAPSAKFAIVNVPDVTTIPFVTTFPPFALGPGGQPLRRDDGSPRTLFGNEGSTPDSLAPNDFILLTAADSMAIGVGFPVGTRSYLTGAPGNGRPLPNRLVLSHAEAVRLQGVVALYNLVIDSVATGRGGAVVDLNGLLKLAATTGISYQGTRYTTEFVTGGLFSLDGVHLNDLAQGMLANVLIDAVNAKFGASVPRVDLATVASASSSRLRPAGGEGRALPWIRDAESVYARMFPWRALPAP
jgi:hypothetical protein